MIGLENDPKYLRQSSPFTLFLNGTNQIKTRCIKIDHGALTAILFRPADIFDIVTKGEYEMHLRLQFLESTTNGIVKKVEPPPIIIKINSNGAPQVNETTQLVQENILERKAPSVDTNELLKVVTDEGTGQYAAVSADARILSLKDRFGNPVWTNDIIGKFGTNLPIFSDGKINSLKLIDQTLVVFVGKEAISIDVRSGKVLRADIR